MSCRVYQGAVQATVMAKRGRTIVWQFTIGFGFLAGFWTAIGIDPEDVILTVIGTMSG
jgi:hypothetical protein